jgi:anthranilate/para-aminobenzoate synthase component I
MEILDEVEEAERGPYCGAIGFFRGPRELELSIAIRTGVAAGDRLLYQAGGGIVADSDAEREWEETELKIAALRRALETRDREAERGDSARTLPEAMEARSER